MKNYLLVSKCLHIIKPTLYGEWHNGQDLLQLIEKCTNLKTLDFTIAGSSSWCAYLPVITQITTIQARPENASKLLDVVGNSVEFRIDDLTYSFPNVENVCLNGLQVCFNRNVELNGNPLPALSSLTLEDCIWEYPNQIDDLSSIENLKVIYSTHHFTHSERLRSFAQTPPVNLKTLTLDIMATTLATIRDDSSPSEYNSVDMAWQPLLKHKCTSLINLELRGFGIPGEEFFRSLPTTICDLKLTCRYEKQISRNSLYFLKQHKTNNPNFSMQLNGKYFRL